MAKNDLLRDAYAVLLPAFADLELDENVLSHLDNGGVALLFGETRDEYVNRSMSPQRRADETAGRFAAAIRQARERAGSPVLAAVDQELNGIRRLHDLVPQLPRLSEATVMSSREISLLSGGVAARAREIGVNLFLSPIVDVVSGENPWLEGRHLGANAQHVSRIARAFIHGVQSAGVAATAKHFPGHPVTELDPALHEAVVASNADDLRICLEVFRDVIADGVMAIMAGPALVPAIDPVEPSSTSITTMELLRVTMGFSGLIISDDLDAPGIARGRDLPNIAVASLKAGADLLLLSSGAGLDRVARSIVAAVEEKELKPDRLAEAAHRVRELARKFA